MRRIAAYVGLTAAFALAILALVAVYAARTPSDYFLFMPDPAQPIAPVVTVAGEPPDGSSTGPGLLYVAVLERRASLLEQWTGRYEDGADLVPEESVVPKGLTDEQVREQGKADMDDSQQIAAAVGECAAGRDVGVVQTVAEIEKGSPAEAAGVKVGDVIVDAAGEEVDVCNRLRETLGAVAPGTSVDLVVRRSGAEVPLQSTTRPAEDDPKRATIGVYLQTRISQPLPVAVKYLTKGVGGPSAGLGFALEVYAKVTGTSLVGGHRVAVTGTIDLGGGVGAIGGVKQKAIGARQAGADVFLVPTDNAAEATRWAPDGLRVIAVATFKDAVDALASLAPATS